MGLKKLSLRHKQIAVMLLSNTKVPDIAEKFNMHPKSVYRILSDLLFNEYSARVFSVMVHRCIEKLLEDIDNSREMFIREKEEKREKRRLLSKHSS